MNACPKISVVVPIYNVNRYLRQCINSIIAQTLNEIEIICVDDGSTDDSSAIIAEYAAKDSRIRVLSRENGGLSAARNTGLDAAIAPFIMFCDGDDWYEPSMCEKLWIAITKSRTDIAICGTDIIYESNEDLRYWDNLQFSIKFEGKHIISDQILLNTNVTVWNKIYKKNIIDRYRIRFPEGLKFEDAYFFNAYMACADNAFFFPEKLYHYRRRQGSIMHDIFTKKRSADSIHHLLLVRLLYDFYEYNHFFPQKYEYWAAFFLRYYKLALAHTSSDEQRKEIRHLAESYVKAYINNTNALPFDLERTLKSIHSKSRKSFFDRILRIKETYYNKKFYLFGLPLLRIKYCYNSSRYYLFSIMKAFRKSRKGVNVTLKLSSDNFAPFSFDDHVILEKLRELRSFTYIPNPGNIGDMLIATATFQFFKKYKLPYTVYNKLRSSETIVFGGGGLWMRWYEHIWGKKIFPLFKTAKKIVVLPSSFYDCEHFLKQLDGRFTVFCRDLRSYEYLLNANSGAEILLDHDMAFRLDSSIFNLQNAFFTDDIRNVIAHVLCGRMQCGKIGMFLRTDRERTQPYPTDMDISSYAYCKENVSKEYAKQCAVLMLATVDSVDAVITDRLHVGIASAIMGKETYLMDNSYKKVSAVYAHSLRNCSNVKLVDRIPHNINPRCSASNNLLRLYYAMQKS